MALAQSDPRRVAGKKGVALNASTTVQCFGGGLAGIRGPDHATTQGDAAPYNNEAGMIFAGVVTNQVLGDATATPPPEARLNLEPGILTRIAVTGATGRGDIGAACYATDDDTVTLTRPANAEVIGLVIEYHTGTTCDVYVFDLDARAAASTTTDTLYLGTIDFASTADGDIRTGIEAPYHGEIISLFGMVSAPLVGAGGTTLLNLELDAVNVTGGALTMSTAAGGTLGAKLSATAITAANVFSEGSLIDVEATASGGTRTSGAIDLFAKVQRRPGA
jgi:hypothetical protein